MIVIPVLVLNFNYGNMLLIGTWKFEFDKRFYFYYSFLRKAVKVDLTSSVNMLLQNAIKDIQFAPNFGQSYHLLAVASNDIDLFTIKPAK